MKLQAWYPNTSGVPAAACIWVETPDLSTAIAQLKAMPAGQRYCVLRWPNDLIPELVPVAQGGTLDADDAILNQAITPGPTLKRIGQIAGAFRSQGITSVDGFLLDVECGYAALASAIFANRASLGYEFELLDADPTVYYGPGHDAINDPVFNMAAELIRTFLLGTLSPLATMGLFIDAGLNTGCKQWRVSDLNGWALPTTEPLASMVAPQCYNICGQMLAKVPPAFRVPSWVGLLLDCDLISSCLAAEQQVMPTSAEPGTFAPAISQAQLTIAYRHWQARGVKAIGAFNPAVQPNVPTSLDMVAKAVAALGPDPAGVAYVGPIDFTAGVLTSPGITTTFADWMAAGAGGTVGTP